MISKLRITSLLFLAFVANGFAQDDLLKELDNNPSAKKEVEIAAFKGLQVVNMQSTKLAAKGEWYFLVSHRFGDVTQGLDNFFGLDNAYTKLGGLYGVTDWMTVGLSRQTHNKIFELTGKFRLMPQQVDGFPVTITTYGTMDVNTDLSTDEYPDLQGSDRLAYTLQMPISRKFSPSFSLELNPIFVHKNLYEASTEKENEFLVAAAGRYKITKRMSINLEYAARTNAINNSPYENPLSIGLDIETGGHVFQLLFSNSQAMNDVSYFTNGVGKWISGPLFFGFNLYRVF